MESGRGPPRNGLGLNEAEAARIQAKFPANSSPQAGIFYADGVFEGGGVLGLAFLGAAGCFAEVGIRWKGLARTSAGAITASLLGVAIDDLERIFGAVDFRSFVGEKTSRRIIDFHPSEDLDHPAQMLVRLLVAQQLGQYSSEPFRRWLQDSLKLGGVATFTDIGKDDPEHWLKVVVSDLTHGQMLVLPDDLPEGERATFPVAEAVRLSMSIPLFFARGGCTMITSSMVRYPEQLPGVDFRRDGSIEAAPVADVRLPALRREGRPAAAHRQRAGHPQGHVQDDDVRPRPAQHERPQAHPDH